MSQLPPSSAPSPGLVAKRAVLSLLGSFVFALGLAAVADWHAPLRLLGEWTVPFLLGVFLIAGGAAVLALAWNATRLARVLSWIAIGTVGVQLVQLLAALPGAGEAGARTAATDQPPTRPVPLLLTAVMALALRVMSVDRLGPKATLTASILVTLVLGVGLLAFGSYWYPTAAVFDWLALEADMLPSLAMLLLLDGALAVFLFAGAEPSAATARRTGPIPAWIALVSVSVILWQALEAEQHRRIGDVTGWVANRIGYQVSSHLDTHARRVSRLADRWGLYRPQEDQFVADARDTLAEMPGFSSILWVDPTGTVRAVVSPEDLNGLRGATLALEPRRRRALDEARETGQPVIAPKTELRAGHLDHSIYVPVYRDGDADGFLVATLRHPGGLNAALASTDTDYAVQLFDGAEPLAEVRTGWSADPARWGRSYTFPVLNREWRVVVTPTGEYLAANRTFLPRLVLFAGLLTATLLALALSALQASRRYGMALAKTNASLREESRRRTEITEALRRSEARFSGILNLAQEAVISIDGAGKIVLFNRSASRLFGYDAADVLGRSPAPLFPRAKAELDGLLERGGAPGEVAVVELVATRRDGSTFVAEASGSYLDLQDETVRTVVLRDITARRLAERALRESERRYAAITANVPGAVFRLLPKPDGGIAFDYVSRGITDVTGIAPDDLLASADRFLGLLSVADRRRLQESLEAAAQRLTRWTWDGRLVLPDGSARWVSLVASPSAGSNGRVTWDGLLTDVTQAKTYELEVERSREQLKALSKHLLSVREQEKAQIAREVHDELGGTLTAVKMGLAWLADRVPAQPPALRDKIGDLLRLADSAVQSTRRITTELRPAILDDLGLAEAIQWQAREFQRRAGILTRAACEPDDLELPESVSIALFRVCQEALTNVARHANARRVDIRLERRDGRVALEVVDDGAGFTLERVLRPESHGLRGMEERIEPLGGELRVMSEPGAGTRVRAEIPVSDVVVDIS
ncbi:MAG: PAS domain S-box protein [Pseudomonadota bacterium]